MRNQYNRSTIGGQRLGKYLWTPGVLRTTHNEPKISLTNGVRTAYEHSRTVYQHSTDAWFIEEPSRLCHTVVVLTIHFPNNKIDRMID